MAKIFMLEGYDGSGKTSVAKEIAKRLGIRYCHFFSEYGIQYDIEPLSVTEDELINMTKKALDKALECKEDTIFDRGLITPISALPEKRWDEFKKYFEQIPLVMCYANLEDTISRLKARHEDESTWYDNEYWININIKIAQKFHVPIVNTSTSGSLEESVKYAMKYFGLEKNIKNRMSIQKFGDDRLDYSHTNHWCLKAINNYLANREFQTNPFYENIIAENDTMVVMANDKTIVPGHVNICPKRFLVSSLQFNAKERKDFISILKKVTQFLKERNGFFPIVTEHGAQQYEEFRLDRLKYIDSLPYFEQEKELERISTEWNSLLEKNSAMHAHIHVIPHKLSEENTKNCVELMEAEKISGYDEFFKQKKKGRFDYFIDNNKNFYLNNKYTGKPPYVRLLIGEETGLKYLRTNTSNSVVYYENTFDTLDIFEKFDKNSFFTKQRIRTRKETEKLKHQILEENKQNIIEIKNMMKKMKMFETDEKGKLYLVDEAWKNKKYFQGIEEK